MAAAGPGSVVLHDMHLHTTRKEFNDQSFSMLGAVGFCQQALKDLTSAILTPDTTGAPEIARRFLTMSQMYRAFSEYQDAYIRALLAYTEAKNSN